MRNNFPKRPSGALLHILSKFRDVPVGFAPPPSSFEAVNCFICSRRRLTVARYRMICLVLDRKQDLNVLYQVCVFRADRKNKMAALASDCLRHFGLKCYYAFFLVCCGCDTSFIVSVHIQCQASIYTLSVCRGHSWRVRLAKQEALTPLGHLVSPLVCRGPYMSKVVLYCWCHSDSASVLLYFTFSSETNEWNSTKLNRKEDLNVSMTRG